MGRRRHRLVEGVHSRAETFPESRECLDVGGKMLLERIETAELFLACCVVK